MNRRWLWSLAILLLLAAGSYVWFAVNRGPELPAGIVYGNGHIEATEVRVAPEVAGRIVSHHLAEGERVREGQVLAVLDPQTNREQLRIIQAELSALRQSASALESQIELWRHHSETAQRRLERAQQLLASRMASPRDIDAAEDALREAQAQLETLEAERRALNDRIASSEARARLAEQDLERTEVRSPLDATVLVRTVEAGELVAVGQPVALLADLEQLELEIYLSGEAVGKVALGDPARIRIDAFPERYFTARVTQIDDFAQFTPRDIHLPQERVRLVYGVNLALANPEGILKPGMPADAWVRWQESQPWPERLKVPAR